MLAHATSDLASVEISEENIIEMLSDLQMGYQQLFVDTRSRFDTELESGELLAPLKEALLSLPVITESLANELMTMASGDFDKPVANAAIFTDYLDDYFDTTAAVNAQNHLATTNSAAVDYDPEADRMIIIQEILNGIASFNYEEDKLTLLRETMMSAFSAEEDLVDVIVDLAEVKQLAAPEQSVAIILTSDALIDTLTAEPVYPVIDLAGFGDQFAAIKLLHKLFPLAASLELDVNQLSWLLTTAESLGWLAIDAIPYDAGMTALDYQSWLNLLSFVRRQKTLTPVADPVDAAKFHP